MKSGASNKRVSKPLHRGPDPQMLKYDALIESIGEGLIVIDENGYIERVNPYALEALGYTENDLVGTWFPATVIMVDEYGEKIDPIARPMARALTEGHAISEYVNLLRKDGRIFPALITASPIIIANKPVGAIELFRDLSRERELDMAKDEFVSIASHQLRTPATGIKGILSMMLAGDFGEIPPGLKRYIEMAARTNDLQLNIIEDLLNVAQADAGRMDLNLVEIDLEDFLGGIVAQHEVYLITHQQVLVFEFEPGLRALIDCEKMKMVIDNLINNASKYTPVGGTIEIKLSSNGSFVDISVQDNGVGIPKDKLGLIFSKFARVDNELSVPAGGTGLGLYLARKIARLHRGDITATSEIGIGSTFSVQLPLIRE